MSTEDYCVSYLFYQVLENSEPGSVVGSLSTEDYCVSYLFYQVLENSEPGAVVGSLSADDPDNKNKKTQTATFSLVEDSKGRFLIKGNNLQIARSSVHCGPELCSLDYLKEPELQVVVRATDDGAPPLHVDKLLVIKLEDVNDPPKDIRLSSNTIRENLAANTVIGKNLSLALHILFCSDQSY